MITRIGIIADIHGHLQRLILAYTLLQSLDVSFIICAGDLVNRGENSAEVIRFMREHQISTVQGNNDADPDDLLKSDALEYLNTLPVSLHLTLANTRVSVWHGAPWDQEQHVYPDSPPSLGHLVLEEADSDIVILGHTHIPMCLIDRQNRRVINSGAVFGIRHRKEIATCAVLDLPGRDFTVYDIETRQPYPLQVIHI